MRRVSLVVIALVLALSSCAALGGRTSGKAEKSAPGKRKRAHWEKEESARRMIRASEGALAPVYGPLAEQIAGDFNLAEAEGIGIDVGSGPGTLAVELCKRTDMHWINADVNPHFFPYFYDLAEKNGVGHRVSAIRADAQYLPFRTGYADVIVSRGSYQFWNDRKKGFKEIYRVLKPGGVAYIGRGFARDMPVSVARQVRKDQDGGPQYDRFKHAKQHADMMKELGIEDWNVNVPTPEGSEGVSYGVWVTFRKPVAEEGLGG